MAAARCVASSRGIIFLHRRREELPRGNTRPRQASDNKNRRRLRRTGRRNFAPADSVATSNSKAPRKAGLSDCRKSMRGRATSRRRVEKWRRLRSRRCSLCCGTPAIDHTNAASALFYQQIDLILCFNLACEIQTKTERKRNHASRCEKLQPFILRRTRMPDYCPTALCTLVFAKPPPRFPLAR